MDQTGSSIRLEIGLIVGQGEKNSWDPCVCEQEIEEKTLLSDEGKSVKTKTWERM